MPRVDGVMLGRRVKAHSKLKKTRLVMLNPPDLSVDTAELTQIGFDACLLKPVRGRRLFNCLKTIFGIPDGAADQTGLMSSTEMPSMINLRNNPAKNNTQAHRILLVEDNETNQKLALHLLSRFGFDTDAVNNGREALVRLATVAYDLVLMDIQMPVMDGLEATVAIRNPDSEVLNHNVPIIAMTAYAMKGDREKCLRSGMNDYISKPVNPKLLLETIERFIHRE
jgi:CheY-like chemotaxis protein